MSLNTTDHYWSFIQDRWSQRAHLKWRARIYSGATPSRDNVDYWTEGVHPWIGSGEVNQGLVIQPTALISDLAVEETSTKLMRKGALVIALAGQGKTKGTVAQLGIDCFGNQSLSCIDARNDDDRFLFWWLTSLYRQIRGLASDDSRDGLNQEMVGSIPIPIIESRTQRIIADYLDRETARIDGLIAEKERMLALLEEKRLALISRVVTRGHDPTAPLRPCGLEWVGEIPEDWGVWRLKHLAAEALSYGANEAALEDNPNWPRFVRITDIAGDGSLRDETFKSLPPEIAEPFLLKDGDLLFARSGATVGKSFIYKPSWGVACFAGYLIRFRCDKQKVLPDYLSLYAQSSAYWHQVSTGTIQATIQNFSAEKYADVFVPLPPIKTQLEIVSVLASEQARFEALTSEIRTSLKLMKERRSALITAAVTGNIPLGEMAG